MNYPTAPKAGIYYKATREDGTDFRTGMVQYAVGKTVRPLPFDGSRSLCGPGYLHASDTPAMTLIGGRWPCRLFEVAGKPYAGFNGYDHKHKGGFKQLRVIRELPAHWALGPNGLVVSKVIERTRQIDREEAQRLDAAWYAARDAARDAAWYAAWYAILAYLTRDLITPAQFEKLAGPWLQVIGDIEKEEPNG